MRSLLPLTHPQKRIWYMEKIYPGTSLYNIGGPVHIKGNVDFELLEKSINIFIKRNDGLRLRITSNEGEPMQYLTDYEETKINFFDFTSYDKPEKEFQKWVDTEARTPFILEDNCLFILRCLELLKRIQAIL